MLTSMLVLFFMAGLGCRGFGGKRPTHLLFAQKTTLGVDVAPSLESGNVHLVVGYKRRTTAFVPSAQVPLPKPATAKWSPLWLVAAVVVTAAAAVAVRSLGDDDAAPQTTVVTQVVSAPPDARAVDIKSRSLRGSHISVAVVPL